MEIILPIILVVLFVLLFNTIVKNYTKASKNQNDIPLDRTDTNIDFADTYEAYQETEYEADVYEINEVNCEKEFCNKAHCEDKANTTGQEDKTPLIEKTEIKKEQKEKVKKQSVPTKLIQKASNWYCVKVLTQKTGKEFFPNTLRKNDADAIFDLDRWYGYYNASTSTSAYTDIFSIFSDFEQKINTQYYSSDELRTLIKIIVDELEFQHSLPRPNIEDKLSEEQKKCLTGLKKKNIAFYMVPSKLVTADFCWAAVRNNGHTISFIPEKYKTPAMVKMAEKIISHSNSLNTTGKRYLFKEDPEPQINRYVHGSDSSLGSGKARNYEKDAYHLMYGETEDDDYYEGKKPHIPGLDQECRYGDLYDQFDYISDHYD